MRDVRAAAAAVAFLTRVPVRMPLEASDVARGAALFPVVGLGIGAAVGGIATLPLPAPVAAVLAVAAGAALTGALHLDGLADTADALGGRTREQALEIMRDHAIGAYGAVALVLDLGLRVTTISVLGIRDIACAAAVARVVPVLLGVALPYARSAGTGGFLADAGIPTAAAALVLGAVPCLLLGRWPLALVPVATAALAAPLLRAWLGGVTGDTLGAAVEVAELSALVLAVALT
jgi:adenosylcobinamide-GDP ribazoletransferase